MEIYGMMKTSIDAHTMGIHAATALLRECGFIVEISPEIVEHALTGISADSNQKIVADWIRNNRINHLGISYRLDPIDAVNLVGRVVALLRKEQLYECDSAIVRSIHFAGLKPACDRIDKEFNGRINTFRGGESAEETLIIMGVAKEDIPKTITKGCQYDKELLEFGETIVNSGKYFDFKPLERNHYPNYGTHKDTLVERLEKNFVGGFQPLIRAHSGPFSADLTREQCLKEYNEWCRELATTGYLDILSIGSSQLSQSNFGENWGDKVNGGGVPVNSELEYADIFESAKPMLVRTYSGTKNVQRLAEMYERTINNAWHALSLWWFDELDGRGPNPLYTNLREHIDTIKYIASVSKPIETNVPHHFAFRGSDDVTYIVSEYLAASIAKKSGAKTFVLQNMLNTPRSTWGVQDLAKSRVMIKLVKELQDDDFRVILQTRAGLDCFKPDIEAAKVQLAAVTALMDDIDPTNVFSPEIIHVVSYSEALFLATPDVINDSIKITRTALNEYRKLKKQGMTPDVMTDDIKTRMEVLEKDARQIISAMEENIPDLYSPEGLYLAFTAGFLPVPELWANSEEFLHARCWQTKMMNGGVALVDNGLLMPTETRINKCVSNIPSAQYNLKTRYL